MSENPNHQHIGWDLEHNRVERTEEQGIWDMVTKTTKPMIVSYRADGCVTWEAKPGD